MGMNPKGKKHRLFHISRRNILDFVSTFAILLVAAGVSSLLVRLSNSSANVAAVFTLAVLVVAWSTEGFG